DEHRKLHPPTPATGEVPHLDELSHPLGIFWHLWAYKRRPWCSIESGNPPLIIPHPQIVVSDDPSSKHSGECRT
ncbi:hypothetical protein LINPERPRIM_LOCUS8664, partial [Linum perenne]